MKKIPKSHWAHTNELIDFEALKGKRVAIIGGGDAGFDAARIALDHHAKSADMFIRRPVLPTVNPGRELAFFAAVRCPLCHLNRRGKMEDLPPYF